MEALSPTLSHSLTVAIVTVALCQDEVEVFEQN